MTILGVGVLAAVLLGVVGRGVLAPRHNARVVPEEPTPGRSERTIVDDVARERFVRKQATAITDLEAEERSLVTGVVVSMSGRAIGGARAFVGVMRKESGGGREDRRSGITDADGRFQIRVPFVRPHETVRVGAIAKGFAPAEGECRRTDAVRHAARVRLDRSPVFRGRVVGVDSKPVANAKIRLGARVVRIRSRERLNGWVYSHVRAGVVGYGPTDGSTFTEISVASGEADRAGRFELTAPFPGSRYYLIAEVADAPARLLVASAGRMEAQGFDFGRIEIRKRADPIAFKLEYADGTPAAGVELVHQMVPQWLQINSAWLRADEHGIVRSKGLSEDAVYTLYIRGGPRSIGKNVTGFRARENATVIID